MKSFTNAIILIASAAAANAACTPTKVDVCNSIGGGFLNLGLLGCGGFKVDPVIDFFRRSDESGPEFAARAEMERALNRHNKYNACKSLSSAGFLNLNLFGCSNFDVSPKVHFFRREGTDSAPGSAGVARSSGTKGHPGTKGTPGTPGSKGVHGKPGTPGTAGTHGTHKSSCPVPVHKSSCHDYSKAGLINLDLLGC
ncbi:hypothetical protein A4X06_0g9438, partial [Tilletia controversa]